MIEVGDLVIHMCAEVIYSRSVTDYGIGIVVMEPTSFHDTEFSNEKTEICKVLWSGTLKTEAVHPIYLRKVS